MRTAPNIPLTRRGGVLPAKCMARSSGMMLWVGLAMIALGIAAIIFPTVATLAVEQFVGWMLMLLGAMLLVGSFSIRGTGPFFGTMLIALLSLMGGAYLLVNPAVGMFSLTLMAGALFLFQGTTEIVLAVGMRPHARWLGMLLSGVASILLALLIAVGWPAISFSVLGILFGVNFISTGVAYLLIARHDKPAA